jgi:hypothetical protein
MVSDKISLRYLCTVISNKQVTDLTNSEECGVHINLGHVIFTKATLTNLNATTNELFSIPINSLELYNAYNLLFSNLNTKSSFVVLRPVFFNGFSLAIPDMIRVYVRTTAVDSFFDKKGSPALERMCAEQIFSDSLMYLSNNQKIVIETSEFLAKGVRDMSSQELDTLQSQNGKILVSQRTTAAQNKSDVTLKGKLSPEQRLAAESMLNTIITSGYKESQRSLAYVPWIEITESVIVNTRTWSLERNPLSTVPLTKIQSISRSEYTERFSDSLGFLLTPRGCGRRRTVTACFSMLTSNVHDTETFLTNRKRSHSDISYLSLSTCLIICKDEKSMIKWKEELDTSVETILLKTSFDLELLTKDLIQGKTILILAELIISGSLQDQMIDIITSIRESNPNFQVPLSFTLSDERIKRLYINDIAERFHQTVLPLQWIHFRCILVDDIKSTNIKRLPLLKSDWTWISHVSEDPMCFLPPSLMIEYSTLFKPFMNSQSQSHYESLSVQRYHGCDWEYDFLFKWRLLHGEGCVVSFLFPRVILHKVTLKLQRVQIQRQENLFLSVVKSLAEQQLGGKIPFKGILKKSDYVPILLGCDALNAKGCSLDLSLLRKQPNSLSKIESNLDFHFAPPSCGTTFAQKLMNCDRLKLYSEKSLLNVSQTSQTSQTQLQSNSFSSSTFLDDETIHDRGGYKFVLESLRKSFDGSSVCGVCYCDPVEIFCLCGHGYCKTCTDIFSRSNTLVVNCPTCRLPLCPFDWISISSSSSMLHQNTQNTQNTQNSIPIVNINLFNDQSNHNNTMVNFSAFGGSYQASSSSYKTLSRVQSILSELNSMFKTRSKLYAQSPGCIVVAPENALVHLKTLLTTHSDNHYTFDIGFESSKNNTVNETKTNETILNDDLKPLTTPPTPRSLAKLTSSLSSSFKNKVSIPQIILVSFEQFINVNITEVQLMIMGIIFATPPPSLYSRAYITAARMASLLSTSKSNSKNSALNLIVLFTTEFEEDEMLIGKRVLKREDIEPKSRSHSNSFSGSELSPK